MSEKFISFRFWWGDLFVRYSDTDERPVGEQEIEDSLFSLLNHEDPEEGELYRSMSEEDDIQRVKDVMSSFDVPYDIVPVYTILVD